MWLAVLPMHQHNRALNLIPRFLLALSILPMLNVLVNVTIGIGDVIQSEKALARLLSCGNISVFIFFVDLFFEFPSVIAVVYHLSCHTTVDAYVLACYEPGFVAAKEQHHVSDVQRVAYASGWLLYGIGAIVDGYAVSIHPGEMVFTLALPARLIARACVSAAMPPLAAV